MEQRDDSDVSELFDLDSLTVSDRLRLFNFAQRDDHVAYLWVLRAMNMLRAVHQLQVHPDDVAGSLQELAASHDQVPAAADLNLRSMLDNLSSDNEQVLYRVEDPLRCGNLAAYRNRQSVYQFTEIGYRVYRAVEEVIGSRVQDANLSRLVFADILADFKALARANREGDQDEVYRKLSRLDSVLEDMTQRAARFYLTLNDVERTTDVSPETFLRYKHALLAHMSEFTAELERYAPRLAEAVYEVEDSGVETLLERAASVDERPMMRPQARLADWRRRWLGLRQWFLADGGGQTRAAQLQGATRTAISGVIALLRQVTDSRRGGVSRTTQLRHLAAWAAAAPDEQAANALVSAAFDLCSVRHLSGAHEDDEAISSRATWWDAPGVEISVSLFRHGKRPTPGGPQPVRTRRGAHARLREEQLAERAADREAAQELLEKGAHERVLNAAETRAVLKLLTRALQARTVVAGRLSGGSGNSDVLTLRLVPDERGSRVRTETGVLHLPGFVLEIEAHGALRRRRTETR